MAKQPFACGECNRILPDPENKGDIVQCKHCPNAPITTDWQGYVIILNPERSEVAARLNVKEPRYLRFEGKHQIRRKKTCK